MPPQLDDVIICLYISKFTKKCYRGQKQILERQEYIYRSWWFLKLIFLMGNHYFTVLSNFTSNLLKGLLFNTIKKQLNTI